jgi:hypothetical protein
LLISSLLPGWRTGNALAADRHFIAGHFIAASFLAVVVSIVIFLNGASRKLETSYLDRDFRLGGQLPINEAANGVAKANGKSDGVDVECDG